jgi:hypothetical protein
MKKTYTILLLLLLLSLSVQAQYFKWVTGGGSNSEPQNQEETVTHMRTDANGNIYVLSIVGDRNIKADTFFRTQAYNVGSTNNIRHVLFTSYSCDGKMRFAKLIEGNINAYAHGIVYSAGIIYVAGIMAAESGKRIGDDAVFSTQYQTGFLSKFDTTGQYQWTKFIGQDVPANSNGVGLKGAVAIDGQGNIHHFVYVKAGIQLTSSITSQLGTYDLKYDVNGNLLSAILLPFFDDNYCVERAEIDGQTNSIYAVFEIIGGSTIRPQNYLIKYNSSYVQQWTDSTSLRSAIASFRVKPGDGIFVVASSHVAYLLNFMGMGAPASPYSLGYQNVLMKLNMVDGLPVWMKPVSGSTSIGSVFDLEILPSYNIAMCGGFAGKIRYKADSIVSPPGGTVNPFLIIMDTAGTLKHLEQMQGSGDYNIAHCITSSVKNSSLYIGGYTHISVKGGSLPPYSSNGRSDFFVMKYGVDCNCTAAMAPTAAFTWAAQGTSSPTANFTYTGTTPVDSVVWDFGDGSRSKQTNTARTYSAYGSYEVCAKVYSTCGVDKICHTINLLPVGVRDVATLADISIYPNPATDIVYVKHLPEGVQLRLYDIMGREVYRSTVQHQEAMMDVSGLSSGHYLLHVLYHGYRVVRKLNKQ